MINLRLTQSIDDGDIIFDGAAANVPMPPDIFRECVKTLNLRFTHRSDENPVCELQAKVFFQKAAECARLDLVGLSSEQVLVLAAALPHHRTLRLTQCQSGLDLGRQLGNGLKHCGKLQWLDLPNNHIGDDGACGLGGGLRHCGGLERLYLKNNQIADDGACGLGDGLQHCGNLKLLDLSNNQIGDGGASGLGDGLHRCDKFEVLGLSNNKVGDDGARGLGDRLKLCGNLFLLELSSNQICDDCARGLRDSLPGKVVL